MQWTSILRLVHSAVWPVSALITHITHFDGGQIIICFMNCPPPSCIGYLLISVMMQSSNALRYNTLGILFTNRHNHVAPETQPRTVGVI